MVVADDRVDRAVEFDAGHFGPDEQPPHVDVVDRIARDGAEHGAHAADDARLLAVRNVVVAHDVVADVLLRPAVFQGALDRLDVAFGRVLRGVVPLVAVLAERDADADRVADRVVLDDPALAPVGADQADLLGGGRRPGRGRVLHREAAHRDVIDPRLLGIEHRLAHVDLDVLPVGIDVLELRPDRGLRFVSLSEPERALADGFEHVLLVRRLGQPVAVQVDRAGVMDAALRLKPVAADDVRERVEVAEETVGECHFPGVVAALSPSP